MFSHMRFHDLKIELIQVGRAPRTAPGAHEGPANVRALCARVPRALPSEDVAQPRTYYFKLNREYFTKFYKEHHDF